MTEHGRRAAGEGDAGLLAAAQLHELRQLAHAELVARAGGAWVDERVTGLSGVTYRRRTRVLRGADGNLHIRILVDDGTRAGSLRPLAEEIVHVLPDGHFLRARGNRSWPASGRAHGHGSASRLPV
jgi:hypothetical protein